MISEKLTLPIYLLNNENICLKCIIIDLFEN